MKCRSKKNIHSVQRIAITLKTRGKSENRTMNKPENQRHIPEDQTCQDFVVQRSQNQQEDGESDQHI